MQIIEVCEKIEAYFVVFVTDYKLAMVRDYIKFRPSIMGKEKNGVVVFALETYAPHMIQATNEKEFCPSGYW